jgi:hypothetical protein
VRHRRWAFAPLPARQSRRSAGGVPESGKFYPDRSRRDMQRANPVDLDHHAVKHGRGVVMERLSLVRWEADLPETCVAYPESFLDRARGRKSERHCERRRHSARFIMGLPQAARCCGWRRCRRTTATAGRRIAKGSGSLTPYLIRMRYSDVRPSGRHRSSLGTCIKVGFARRVDRVWRCRPAVSLGGGDLTLAGAERGDPRCGLVDLFSRRLRRSYSDFESLLLGLPADLRSA